MSTLHVEEYEQLDGSTKTLVKRVGDGSIIKRFEMTPPPRSENDIVCPHYLELKWATGCPFECAWCYLRGSLRHYLVGKDFTVKPYSEIASHISRLFRSVYPNERETLNSGEVADSLAGEHLNPPFSKFIIPLFEKQERYKLVLLTKSNNVKNLIDLNPHNQVIASFSLNAYPVAQKWEKAPPVRSRVEAGKKLFDAGYEVRIRIDPIVPYPDMGWKQSYSELIDLVFSHFYPTRITLGSLRGLQSTINEAADKSWVEYLKESSRWGKRIPFEKRKETFETILNYLRQKYQYYHVALCKEPILMWQTLGMDWRHCKCNCVW